MNNTSCFVASLPIRRRRSAAIVALIAFSLAGSGLSICSATETVPAASTRPSGTMQPSAAELEAYAAIGSAVAQKMRMSELNWNEARFNAFVSGLRAGRAGQSYPFNDAAQHLFDEINRRAVVPSAGQNQAPDQLEQYMHAAKESLMMQQTESGLLCHIVTSGGGPRPRPGDTIVLSFSAKASDGTTDLPQLACQNMRTKVADLLPGLAEGVQMMTLGTRAVLLVPPNLSFAGGQWPEGIDRGTPILFLVDLEDVIADRSAP